MSHDSLPLTRAQLVRSVRALGLESAREHHVDAALRGRYFFPVPEIDLMNGRRVYLPCHVAQLAEVVRAAQDWRERQHSVVRRQQQAGEARARSA